MPRSYFFAAAFTLVACGTDTAEPTGPFGPDIEHPPEHSPDAGAGGGSNSDGGPNDAPPSNVDPLCAEATQHSDFAWLEAKVFEGSCATSECHDADEPAVGLDLSVGKAYNNLVNKGASTVSGWTRVIPGSLDQSYLVVSLGRAAGPPPRDGFMPLEADPLCVEKLEAIERWILAGAPR